MGFWSLKNEHIKGLMILAPLTIPVIANQFWPQYIWYAVGAAFTPIFGFIFVYPAYAWLEGRALPHLKWYMLEHPTGTAYEADALIDKPDPAHKFKGIWPLHMMWWCPKCKKWWYTKELENDRCPVDGCKGEVKHLPVPQFMAERWWYCYLVKLKHGIRVPGYDEKCEWHGVVLPFPWHEFFHFDKREDGAYIYDELMTHPASDLFVSAVAPFHVSNLNVEIPIHLGIFATGRPFHMITTDWNQGMQELARLLPKMDKVLKDYELFIYPNLDSITGIENYVQGKEELPAPTVT